VGEYIYHPLSPLDSKALGEQGTVHAQIVRSSADWSSGILTEHSIQNAYIEVIRNAQHYVYIENQFFITATGDQQAPIKNTIGRAIVDAVVRAAKEGRKFRVVAIIPAIPGFAGDLRDDAALGTRAIMSYQYQSICRGEHSIFGQISAQGVDPTKYVFFFNLRSYDRLNVTPALKKQEEESGVKYQDVQRAEAYEIMDSGMHGVKESEKHKPLHLGQTTTSYTPDNAGDEGREERTDAKRKFEAAAGPGGGGHDQASTDTVAKHAMYQMPPLADEPWEGDLEGEVDNWIQEELYIHGKLLIVDDRTVICGSSNINDRSQLGYHDSELSIVMTDTKALPSKMDGQAYDAGYHAATLRRYLWREHLGLLPPQELDASKDANAQPPDVPKDPREGDTYEFVADPLSDEVWDMWTSRATQNSQVFRELFHADPDNCGMYHPPTISFLNLTTLSVQSKRLQTMINSSRRREPKQGTSTINKGIPERSARSLT
jgi:phospholipase D1/2